MVFESRERYPTYVCYPRELRDNIEAGAPYLSALDK
jgi:hypothetical protein